MSDKIRVKAEGWTFTIVLNGPLEDRTLTTVQKMVFVAISSFVNHNTRSGYPSYNRIAEIAGCCKRSVMSAVDVLVSRGYLIKEGRSDGNGNQTSNLYVIPKQAENVISNEGGEPDTPPPVQEIHPPGAGDAPELEPVNDNHKNYTSSAPAGAGPNGSVPAPLKDDIARAWEGALTAMQPDSTWGNYGKERRACVLLGQRTRRLLTESPYSTVSTLIRAVLSEYDSMRTRSREGYWRTASYTPSALLERWDKVWCSLAENHHVEEGVMF
jgi:hypothetical protein